MIYLSKNLHIPGWSIIPAYVGATALGYYLWVLTEKEISAQRLENSSATIAIMPLVIAEKDRR